MSKHDDTVRALRLIAASADKAAAEMEAGRLWPGDLALALTTIERALQDAQRGNRP